MSTFEAKLCAYLTSQFGEWQKPVDAIAAGIGMLIVLLLWVWL